MDLDLIAAEERLRKLNEKLDSKKSRVVQEANEAMREVENYKSQKQREINFSRPTTANEEKEREDSSNNSPPPPVYNNEVNEGRVNGVGEREKERTGSAASKTRTRSTMRQPPSSSPAPQVNDDDSGRVDSNVDPPSGMGGEAMLRYQKARIRVLTDELNHTIEHQRLQEEKIEKLKSIISSSKDESKSSDKKVATLQEKLQKADGDNGDLKVKLEDSERQIQTLRRDLLEANKKAKDNESERNARDVRLNRALEEVEKYKALLENEKSAARDGNNSSRKDVEKMQASIRKLERQKGELIGAFKKQMKLIDILKRQKIHMEASKLLSFTEDEFAKILEVTLQ